MSYTSGTMIAALIFFWMMKQTAATSNDMVFFRPILVQKYNEVSTLNKPSDIWMNVREGLYANFSSMDKAVKIGKPVTILIYLNDLYQRDIAVDQCWAYNEPIYDKASIKLPLMISSHAELQQNDRKSILVNPWTKDVYSNSQNVTTVLYTNLTSFKFPQKEYVYIACTVYLCHESCEENYKQSLPASYTTSARRDIQLPSLVESAKLLFGKLKPSLLETHATSSYPSSYCNLKSKKFLCLLMKPHCYSGSKDPECQSKPPQQCYPGSQDPHCNNNNPPHCYPGSQDPHCNSNNPHHCYPGSQDPHCNSNNPHHCYPGSQDPYCNSNNPHHCYPGSQDPHCNSHNPHHCYPGSQDPHCNSHNPHHCYPGSQDPYCNSNNPHHCYPGSQDPHCNSNNPHHCYPGSQDPYCNSNNPHHCYPGSQDPYCNSNNPHHCYPGSQDPHCNNNNPSHCYPGSPDPHCNTNHPPPICYPGSQDPRCINSRPPPHCQPGSQDPQCTFNSPSQHPPATEKPICLFGHLCISTNAPFIYKKPKPPLHCILGSSDPNCHGINEKVVEITTSSPALSTTIQSETVSLPTHSNCVDNSFDPNCALETSTKKLAYNPFLAPNCYPGSKDPRCTTPTIQESESETTQSVLSLKPPNCYPGSKDPNCINEVTTVTPIKYSLNNNTSIK